MLSNACFKIIKKLNKDKKGGDIVAWVGLIAIAIGILLFIFPTTRDAIGSFVSTVMDKLKSTAIGG